MSPSFFLASILCLVLAVDRALLTAASISSTSPSSVAPVVTDRELTKISYQELRDLFVDDNEDGDSDNEDEDEKDKRMFENLRRRGRQSMGPLLRRIEEAFGSDAAPATADDSENQSSPPPPVPLGFLEITHVPVEMVRLRSRVLPSASKLANLPPEELSSLELPETGYSIGWSHGRESFRRKDDNEGNDGSTERRYDTAKGSFYFDPFFSSSSGATANVYPPSLQPRFERDLVRMTKFMSRVGTWIAVLCDLYLHRQPEAEQERRRQRKVDNENGDRVCDESSHPKDDDDADNDDPDSFSSLFDDNEWMIYQSLKSGRERTKARLLYYYPPKKQPHQQANATTTSEIVNRPVEDENDDTFDDWCGWHRDHGSLTALLPGMIIEEKEDRMGGGEDATQPHWCSDSPPPADSAEAFASSSRRRRRRNEPGLYIRSTGRRHHPQELVHVKLAPTSLGFQLGETLQIMSRGKFVATPHAVKAPPFRSSNNSDNGGDACVNGSGSKIGRGSLAVFLEPASTQILPPLVRRDNTIAKDTKENSSALNDSKGGDDDELSLESRWRSTFGEFERITIETFS